MMAPSAQDDGGAVPDSGVAVLDLGAGNGNLALLSMLVLNCTAVLIDRTAPIAELQTENYVPEALATRMLRFVSDVGDVDVKALVTFLRSRGISRVVVVAKHLCGLGSDLAVSFAESLMQYQDEAGGMEVLGVVAATCCVNKIRTDAEVSQYCAMYPVMAEHAALATTCTRHCTWRTTGGHANTQQSKMTPWQIELAELFEDLIQAPRITKLQELFAQTNEVLFTSQEHSLQNRCLVASQGSLDGMDAEDDSLFFQALQAAQRVVHRAAGGPLDLKPVGLASAKYGYDGGS